MTRSFEELAVLADQVKAGAERAMASIEDMLVFVKSSDKRIDAMEAAHQLPVVARRKDDVG